MPKLNLGKPDVVKKITIAKLKHDETIGIIVDGDDRHSVMSCVDGSTRTYPDDAFDVLGEVYVPLGDVIESERIAAVSGIEGKIEQTLKEMREWARGD